MGSFSVVTLVFSLLLLVVSGSLNTTGFPNETTDLPTNGTNITSSEGFNTSSPFPIWSLSGSCKSPQPMCCYGINNSCYRGCFCDQACRYYRDCCPDYNSTCSGLTMLDLNGTTPDFNNTKTLPLMTPVLYDSNETTLVHNGTDPLNTTSWIPPSTSVPLEYSRSCRQEPPLCCMSYDPSCYRGCYCDVGCLRRGDCCPDFKETCVTDSNGTTPDVNNTETPLVTPEYSRSCRQDPPLCCMSYDYSCYRGCHCDVGCLRRGDCCPDFKETCVTGFPNETADLPTNGTNISSSGGFNASSSFPIWSLSGSCKSPQPMCCPWYDLSCYRGCFCDRLCRYYGDCCSDHNSTCSVTVLLNLNVRLRVPITMSESEIQSAVYTEATQVLQNNFYGYWWYNYNVLGLRVASIARKP